MVALAIALTGCTAGGERAIPRDGGRSAPNDGGRIYYGEDASNRDAGPPRNDLDDVQVWAHSPTELFAFDPRTMMVRRVGRFHFADGRDAEEMTDLAVDSTGLIVTCSFERLYAVNPADAQVTLRGPLDLPANVRFNGLTFLPSGELGGDAEALIASTAEGDLYRVNPTTGAATRIGQFGDGWGSSGDLVSVADAGTFAIVTREGTRGDVLARVDPRTGAVTMVGPTGTSRLFGLGYWRNRLFAFSSLGWLFALDIATGDATLISNRTGADIFNGAGVVTNAPTAPF